MMHLFMRGQRTQTPNLEARLANIADEMKLETLRAQNDAKVRVYFVLILKAEVHKKPCDEDLHDRCRTAPKGEGGQQEPGSIHHE